MLKLHEQDNLKPNVFETVEKNLSIYVGDLGSTRLVRRRKGLFSGAANDAFGNGQSGPPLAGR